MIDDKCQIKARKWIYFVVLAILFSCLDRMGCTRNDANILIGMKIKMYSNILEKEMHLSVHVPDDYDSSEERYPVLYIFQTHFAQVSGAVKNLYDYVLTPRMIVVSVDSYEFGYLTPTKIQTNPNSGKADVFLRFFKEELFPYIDTKYRTEEYRIVFSNSWGGLFIAYAILAKPDVFNAGLASIPWIMYDGDDRFMINNTAGFLQDGDYHHRFLYMTMGDEAELLPDLPAFIDVLNDNPKPGLKWEYHHWPEEDHTSTPYRTIHSGLRALFGGWNSIPDAVVSGGLEEIKKYEITLNEEFNYNIGVSATALRLAGQRLQRDKRYSEAIAVFLYAVEKNPDNPFAYATLGRAYEEINQLKSAKEVFEKGYQIAVSISHPQVKWVKSHLDRVNQQSEGGGKH